MNLNLKNKIVFISGSSSGIGKSIGECFLQEGAYVIFNGKNEKKLVTTVKQMKNQYGDDNVSQFLGDLTKDYSIESLYKYLKSNYKNIDIFISNLGSGSGSKGWNVDDKEWDRLFEINFNVARKISTKLIPLINYNGAIIYISSIAGLEVIGAPIHYSVAKSALISYAKNLSFILAENNIRVNVVCPGNIYFKGGTWDKKVKENKDKVTEMLNNNVALKRLGKPKEISDVVTFLASERASFMTGSTIVIDGGQLNRIL